MEGPTVVHRGEDPPGSWEQSMFVAGPADAGPGEPSWKARAVPLLAERGYRGVVFVDDNAELPGAPRTELDRRWASYWRRRSDMQLCWLPEHAQDALELVRLGEWCQSGRVVAGVADGAFADGQKLRRWATDRLVPNGATLTETIDLALRSMPAGSRRVAGEREVPLLVWNTPWFQGWLAAQRSARNRLLGVEDLWTFRTRPGRRQVVLWILRPRLRIVRERREIASEVVIGRTDPSAVMLYRRGPSGEMEVVLVRDCRPAARTPDGYVWELPGGSGDAEDPRLVAAFEFRDEVGLALDPARLRAHGAQQVWPTAAAHVTHLFSAQATASEMEFVRSLHGKGARGLHGEQEYTFPEVVTAGELLGSPHVGFETRGMVTTVLHDIGALPLMCRPR